MISTRTDTVQRMCVTSLVARVAVGTIVALMLALATSVSKAAAYTIISSGYPGAVGAPATQAYSTSYGTGALLTPDRSISESAAYARSDQYVCVTMNLVSASGTPYWMQENAVRNCAWIRAAYSSTTVRGAWFNDLLGMNLAIYSVNVVVTWQLSNGSVIGKRTLDYNQPGDYQCQTAYCAVKMTMWGGGAYVTFSR